MACLDTTFLIDLARRKGGRKTTARALLRKLVEEEERLCTTRFSVAELYVGVHRSRNREKEQAAVQAVLNGVEILEFTATAAEIFGRLTARLQEAGTPSGDMDVLIAATALSEGETTVVTRNGAHYVNIPGITAQAY